MTRIGMHIDRAQARQGSPILLRDGYEKLAWLLAAALLGGLVVIWLAGLVFHSGRGGEVVAGGTSELLRADAVRPQATRMVQFVPRGADMEARDATTGKAIRMLEFQRDGFVVSIVKSLGQDRRRLELPTDAAYRLMRWDNGQVLFEDPQTGAQIELSAFGQTNVAAFASLLEPARDAGARN